SFLFSRRQSGSQDVPSHSADRAHSARVDFCPERFRKKSFDIPAYAAGFPARGLPAFLAYIAVPAEFFGGIALILGLATRYVVLVVFVFMLVATFSSPPNSGFTDVSVCPAHGSCFSTNIAT